MVKQRYAQVSRGDYTAAEVGTQQHCQAGSEMEDIEKKLTRNDGWSSLLDEIMLLWKVRL